MAISDDNERKRDLSSFNWHIGVVPLAVVATTVIVAPFMLAAVLLTAHVFICAGVVGAGLFAGYETLKFFNKANQHVTNAEMSVIKNVHENEKNRGLTPELELPEQPLKNWQNEITTSQSKNVEMSR